MVRARVGLKRVLECEFRPNSNPKASSRNEGCFSLIYYYLTFFLVDVRVEFFSNRERVRMLDIKK